MFELQKNYLTKEWYDKLVQELNEIKAVKLPAIIERLKDAQAQWDLSENFDYDVNKTEKEFAESRIAEIEQMLKNVEIIEESKWGKDSVITFGSKVVLEDEDKDRYTIILVGSGEVEYDWKHDGWELSVDQTNGIKLSFDSPIGIAIRGKKSWEIVKVRLWSGTRQDIKIVSVK